MREYQTPTDWCDRYGNPIDVLLSVNAALQQHGINFRIDIREGQAVIVPVPDCFSTTLSHDPECVMRMAIREQDCGDAQVSTLLTDLADLRIVLDRTSDTLYHAIDLLREQHEMLRSLLAMHDCPDAHVYDTAQQLVKKTHLYLQHERLLP